MDEKILEEFKFHKETVAGDLNSPLHLIREKEMEISGRVLAVKKEAEQIVAEARKKAVEIVQRSEAEGERLAAEEESRARQQVEAEVTAVHQESDRVVEALRGSIQGRMDAAATFVVKAVTHG